MESFLMLEFDSVLKHIYTVRFCLILILFFLSFHSIAQQSNSGVLYNTYSIDSNINFLAIGEVHRDVSSYEYEKQILATYINMHTDDDVVLFLEYSDTLNYYIQRYHSSKDTLDLYTFFQTWSAGSMTNYTFRRYRFLLELLKSYENNSKFKVICVDINHKILKLNSIRDSVMSTNMARVVFNSALNTRYMFIGGAAHTSRTYSPKTKNFDNSKSAIKQLRSTAHLSHLNIGTILIQSKYWYSNIDLKRYKSFFYAGYSREQYEQINTIDFKTAEYILIQPRVYLNDTNFDIQDYFLLNKVGQNIGN
jgi:hypothetical protein